MSTETGQKYPIRLKKQPIIDAVFEIRVQSNAPLASILPGLLYTAIHADGIEPTPAMQIPQQIRDIQPDLAFAHLYRISWGKHWVFVGDKVVSVSTKLPYSGWSELRSAIRSVMNAALNSGFITSVERCSMKYVDLIRDEEGIDPADLFKLELSVGGRRPGKEGFQVRVEFEDDGAHHILQVVSKAKMELINVGIVEGAIFDVDMMVPLKSESNSDFLSSLDGRLEKLHTATKAVFFDSLTEKGLNWLEPVYD